MDPAPDWQSGCSGVWKTAKGRFTTGRRIPSCPTGTNTFAGPRAPYPESPAPTAPRKSASCSNSPAAAAPSRLVPDRTASAYVSVPSTSPTTISPSRACDVFSTSTKSPLQMWSSIMESPRTWSAIGIRIAREIGEVQRFLVGHGLHRSACRDLSQQRYFERGLRCLLVLALLRVILGRDLQRPALVKASL